MVSTMEMGSYLRKMRSKAGLTQEEMAEKLNMSQCNISKLETGRLEVRGIDLIRWVRATNAHEFLAAMSCNFDPAAISNLISNLSQLIGVIVWRF